MINNLIKLFYSDVVKTQINNMPSSDYELKNGFKQLHNITLKIDSIFFKSIKILIALFILYLSFNIKLLLGIGVLCIEIVYLAYKMSYEKQVKKAIENVKNNIEVTKSQFINENSKKGINLLITLLIISLLTGFNYIICISFIMVFIFTLKSIYISRKNHLINK